MYAKISLRIRGSKNLPTLIIETIFILTGNQKLEMEIRNQKQAINNQKWISDLTQGSSILGSAAVQNQSSYARSQNCRTIRKIGDLLVQPPTFEKTNFIFFKNVFFKSICLSAVSQSLKQVKFTSYYQIPSDFGPPQKHCCPIL